jgi:hypothetical protein
MSKKSCVVNGLELFRFKQLHLQTLWFQLQGYCLCVQRTNVERTQLEPSCSQWLRSNELGSSQHWSEWIKMANQSIGLREIGWSANLSNSKKTSVRASAIIFAFDDLLR